jgi:hypothetical protein
VKTIVSVIKGLGAEKVGGDLLGTIFHDLIPFKVRKAVAAFYINVLAAELLTFLAIDKFDAKVSDFALGSGGLLVASYRRKKDLAKGNFDEDTHQQFLQYGLLGVDVMPFAANIAGSHLALQAPQYFSDRVQIAIWDSTDLRHWIRKASYRFGRCRGNDRRFKQRNRQVESRTAAMRMWVTCLLLTTTIIPTQVVSLTSQDRILFASTQGPVLQTDNQSARIDENAITGSFGDDRIRGTNGSDIIIGLSGSDTINGEGGDDKIQGNEDSDKLYGDEGDDILQGCLVSDQVFGGLGNDVLIGGQTAYLCHLYAIFAVHYS